MVELPNANCTYIKGTLSLPEFYVCLQGCVCVCVCVCMCVYAQICATVAIYSQPPSCKHLLFKFTHLTGIELLKLFSI